MQLLKNSGLRRSAMMVVPAVTHYQKQEIAFPIPNIGATNIEHKIKVRAYSLK